MTPIEKNAREIERTLDLYYTETDEDVMKGNQAKASRIDAIASALSEAERRGFERAKELMLEELKTRDFIGPLTVRNMKLEEA